jgi:putative polyketide hydroxylase
MTPDRTPVLVAGAGPVGLSAALLLARHGIACVLVERRETRNLHPKARGVRIRTMELFRQWGLEPELRARALSPEARRFIYCDSLTGEEIGRSPEITADEDRFSPTTACRVAQDRVEFSLRERVAAEPLIDFRPGAEVTGLDQDADGVTVRLRSAEAEHDVRASYLIAADGVASATRRALGVDMEGPAVLAYWHSIHWHGDIGRWAADRPCIQFITGARFGSNATVASVDGHEDWVTMVTRGPSPERPASLGEEEARAIITRAVGSEDFEFEVLDTTTWRLSAQVAATWQVGRVFLAGDAAHSFPPTGGFGMNSGIQEVHNLAWKLALVLNERAGPALLETYAEERKPVAQDNAAWSVANSGRMREISAATADGDRGRFEELMLDQKEHVHALAQDLGYTYQSRAVIGGVKADGETEFAPTATPGLRAPHAWIRRNGERISVLDLFDGDFVLLTGNDAWHAAVSEVDTTKLPRVLGYRSGAEIEVDKDFDAVYELTSESAVLVRPDGHVAWRTEDLPANPAHELAGVLAELTR